MNGGKMFRWHLLVGARIAASQSLAEIPVVTEFPAVRDAGYSFAKQVERLSRALIPEKGRTKSGLAIFVSFPHTETDSSTLGSIRTLFVTELSVVESKIYNANGATGFAPNGVGRHADDVAEELAELLLNWSAQGVAERARPRTILNDHEGWIPPDLRAGDEKFDLYVSAFQVQALAVLNGRPRCYPAAISFENGECELQSATQGATIRYTINGDYPAGNDAETYSAAFSVESGDVVLAVASKNGHDDSDLTMGTAP